MLLNRKVIKSICNDTLYNILFTPPPIHTQEKKPKNNIVSFVIENKINRIKFLKIDVLKLSMVSVGGYFFKA